MSECESVRGRWGEPCPDCGAMLPRPRPVTSWMSQRPLSFTSGSSAGLGAREVGQHRVSRLTPRQQEVLAEVRACGGNRSRAARHLKTSVGNVQVILRAARRRGAKIPKGVAGRKGLPDLRQRVRTA